MMRPSEPPTHAAPGIHPGAGVTDRHLELRRERSSQRLLAPQHGQALAATPELAALEELELSASKKLAYGISALAMSEHVRGLKFLYADKMQLATFAAKALVESPHLRLTGLSLSENPLTAEAVRLLAEADATLVRDIVGGRAALSLTSPRRITLGYGA